LQRRQNSGPTHDEVTANDSADIDDPWYDVPFTLLPTHDKQYVQWTANSQEEFKEWYSTTKWYATKKASNGVLPSWNPVRKNSPIWDHFTELARVKDGRPMIRCNHCRNIYDHPTINNNGGTSQMSRHVSTKGCLNEQKKERRQAHQPSLKESFGAQKVSCT
jgi:hypothetical protein